MTSPLTVAKRVEGSVTRLELVGRLDSSLPTHLQDEALALIQPGRQLVLDLSRLSVTGQGLRMLLLLCRQVRAVDGTIVAEGASPELVDLAESAGFGDLFRQAIAGNGGMATVLPRRARIDAYPTHKIGGYAARIGRPSPYGATIQEGGVNFAVYSRHATAVSLVLFAADRAEPIAELPYPPEFRIGEVFAMLVFGLDVDNVAYGFRMDGPNDAVAGHRFDNSKVLLDPYAHAVSGREVWGGMPSTSASTSYRSQLVAHDFDWENDRPLLLPFDELVVYELHVRGFTCSPTSDVGHPGMFAGLREKIPYLTDLGVNCVELMPIFEFDETDVNRINPLTGEGLCNYWGYSTMAFYAPKAAYAATGAFGMQADELRATVKELHRNGIEVILDVVFNHSSEGGEDGPTISFRGIDNRTYYLLKPDGQYYNFSGCGNTLNCNHPVVREFVIECLRHWVTDYHIDGFRFDLASILGRDQSGAPMRNPPLLEALANDPILGGAKLIAEAWDAGGLYQVGSFPAYGRWSEWNGKFRDCARKYLKGDPGQVGEMATRLAGSSDLYEGRATASINFITCHDGFTLADLVAYNEKHNEANGEDNRDGANDNYSWNCGVEGPASDPAIVELRKRQAKNALCVLLLAQGVPMLLMGDECGRTQHGNNNAYCHDGPLTWLDWRLLETNAELYRFTRLMLRLRRGGRLLCSTPPSSSEAPTVIWHGTNSFQADWSETSRVLAFQRTLAGAAGIQSIYVAMNMYWEDLQFSLPDPPADKVWHVSVNTAASSPGDIAELGHELPVRSGQEFAVGARSVVILIAK